MPHHFFDTFDREGFLPDENGLEFESLAAAKLEPKKVLPELARDTLLRTDATG
jgi:hypothetical protein